MTATMTSAIQRAMLGSVGLVALLTAVPAQAQQKTNSSQASGASDEGIETVVVSARKRAERLLDVPVAASALSSAALERYASTDLTKVGTMVPQVSIDHAPSGNGAIITVRGIGSASVDAAIEQEVTVNIDGVPISRGRVIQQAMFDNSSVEVLKGPQALYFGKNSPAGVISINSVNPGDTMEGYARVGFEANTLEYFGETGISVPLTDDLNARIAVRGSDMTGGYMKGIGGPVSDPANLPLFFNLYHLTYPGSPYHEYPGEKNIIGRITLDWNPTEKFDAAFKFMANDFTDRGDSMAGVIFNCGPGQNHPESLDIATGQYLVDPFGTCSPDKRTNSYGTVPKYIADRYPGSHGGVPFTHTPTILSSLTMDYRVTPEITLTSVTGYYNYDETQFSNYDETVFELASGENDDHFRQWTQEFRVNTAFEGPVNFSGGLFYEHDNRSFKQSGDIGWLGPDTTTGQWNLFGSRDFYTSATYSAFGELNWKIASNLELAGGARYTVEEKNGDEGTTYLHYLFAGAASPAGRRIVGSFTQHNVSPQATLSWHPTEDAMIYAAYKEGFKSGGFSTPALIPVFATPENQEFKEETARGYEGGVKFSEMDNMLTGDVTAYHYTYYGLQLTAFDAATTSYFTQNAASATTDGIEANLSYQVRHGLSVRGSVGYNRARYNDFATSQCWAFQTVSQGCLDIGPGPDGISGTGDDSFAQNLSGKPLSRAPDWVALIGTSYDTALMGSWNLGLTGDLRYSTGYYISTNNSPYAWQGDYVTLDLSARVYTDRWEFAIIGRNLTDAVYGVVGGDKPLGPVGQVIAGLGDPRLVTFQGTYHF